MVVVEVVEVGGGGVMAVAVAARHLRGALRLELRLQRALNAFVRIDGRGDGVAGGGGVSSMRLWASSMSLLKSPPAEPSSPRARATGVAGWRARARL